MTPFNDRVLLTGESREGDVRKLILRSTGTRYPHYTLVCVEHTRRGTLVSAPLIVNMFPAAMRWVLGAVPSAWAEVPSGRANGSPFPVAEPSPPTSLVRDVDTNKFLLSKIGGEPGYQYTHGGRVYRHNPDRIGVALPDAAGAPVLLFQVPDPNFRLDVYWYRDGGTNEVRLLAWAGAKNEARPSIVIRGEIEQLPMLAAFLIAYADRDLCSKVVGDGGLLKHAESLREAPDLQRWFPGSQAFVLDETTNLSALFLTHCRSLLAHYHAPTTDGETTMSEYDEFNEQCDDETLMGKTKQFANDAWEDTWDAGKTGLSAITVQKTVGAMGRKSLEKLIPDEYKGLLDTAAGDILIRLLSPQLLRMGNMVNPLPENVKENIDGISRRAYKGQVTFVTMQYGEALIDALPSAGEMVELAKFAAAMAANSTSTASQRPTELGAYVPDDFTERAVEKEKVKTTSRSK